MRLIIFYKRNIFKYVLNRIPTDPIIADKWTKTIRLSRNEEYWKASKNTRICSIHFNNEDKYFTQGGLCRIRRNAIPVLNLHISCITDQSVNVVNTDGFSSSPEISNVIVVQETANMAGETSNINVVMDYSPQPGTSRENLRCTSDDSDDESLYDKPREAFLRKKLKKSTLINLKRNKAIKILKQKTRRLQKKNKSLRGIIMELRKKRLINRDMSDNLESLAVQLFDAGAVRLGDIEAKVGRRTPIYFDLRVIVSHPQIMKAVAQQLQKLASRIDHDLLCGVPYAALPLASVMSVNNGTPMIMKRKETKLYATKKILEGIYKQNQRCLVVEDVVTSGGSLLEAVATLRAEGLVVTDAVIVLEREQGGANVLKANGVTVHAIFTLSGLVNILNNTGRINNDTVDMILEHIKESQFGMKDNLD